ncbi:MAG: hypothetical protein Q9M92_13685 [Enterobacterales bacterium]|nr:hypothetical protein [Enterobacterales bacterium]
MRQPISQYLDDSLVMIMATEDKGFGHGLLSLRKKKAGLSPN